MLYLVMKISIIVPIYNEGRRAVETVNKILNFTKNNLILVNDGSNDNSQTLLEKNFSKNRRVSLVSHKVNQGKGMAMKTGARTAWKNRAEAVIFIDADGQHDPELLLKFESTLNDGEDVVIGVRINKTQMSLTRKLGNWVIRVILAILYGQTIEDMLCGYRAMTKSSYHKIVWTSQRYGVETEMICNMWKYGLNYQKIVVETIYAQKKQRKKDCFTPIDGLKILLQLPYWWWRGRLRH